MTIEPGVSERLDRAMRAAALTIEGGQPFAVGLAGLAVPASVWSAIPAIPPANPDARAALLGRAASWHAHVGDAATGAGCACALLAHWRRNVAECGVVFAPCLGLADAATWMTVGMVRLGMLDDAVRFVRGTIADLSGLGFHVSSENLRTLAAEGCLAAGRPEQARGLLPTEQAIRDAGMAQAVAWSRPAPTHHVETRRCGVAAGLARLSEAALCPPEPASEAWARELGEAADMLEDAILRPGVDAARLAAVAARARALATGPTLRKADALEASSALLDAFVDASRTTAPGLQGVHPRLHAISVAMAADERFTGSEDDLAWLANADAREGDAVHGRTWRPARLWTRSVLLERRGRYLEACEALEGFRASLDAARDEATTSDIRAGLASTHPNLHSRLASARLRAGADAWSVLEAIEWGKGRWLAEELSATAYEESAFRDVVSSARCHYLAMALGERSTCVVLVTADGEATAKEVPVGRAGVELAVSRLLRRGCAGSTLEGWRESILPLLAWLPAPSTAGPLHEGDMLLLACDGALHALPLHALPCDDGAPLVPRMAVVRTHGAALVIATHLAPRPRHRGFLALQASTSRELPDRDRRDRFDGVVAGLRGMSAEGVVLEGVSADRRTLARSLRPGQIVHLWAHGDAAPEGPFHRNSGILLASDGNLPRRGAAAFNGEHLLSPERVLALGADGVLAGSHVTIQACVSASARANAQGDAIGLEWAFLRAGASSVLACHWHVSYRVASIFSQAFYARWSGSGVPTSRAEAWRRAVVEVGARSDLPHGSWAAMALTGDWR